MSNELISNLRNGPSFTAMTVRRIDVDSNEFEEKVITTRAHQLVLTKRYFKKQKTESSIIPKSANNGDNSI